MKALVIGAGHNGLIASYYLRKLGLEVQVLEARDKVGGMTESLTVNHAVISRASYVLGLMPEELINEFHIPVIYTEKIQTIQYDDKLIPFYRDREKRLKTLSSFFPKYEEFEDKVQKMKKIMKKFSFVSSPPSKESIMNEARSLGVPEILELNSIKFLSEYFPQEVHRYFIYPSMEEAPSYMVAYFFNEWSFVEGGMGSVASKIAERAQSLGVRIKTSTKVDEILVRDDKVKGVRIGNSVVEADIVVSAISPISTLSMVDQFKSIRLDSGGGGWVKYNVVFKETPKVDEQIRPYLDGILDLEVGEIVMPSIVDKTRGKSVLEFMGNREEVLSLFNGKIEYEEKLNADFATKYYFLPGGNLNHLPMRCPYLFDGRPVKGWGYRTPIKGLYLTGAGTYPGGQVTGLPGYNVVLAVKEDLRQGL
ncbi:MAG: NAD(P)/FAD-dependent oxidoreductase [Metallosphaera sp.]|uniref:phytoene desaturase family protein n=1 Tax=Metallosphaera sp. TaxID=2020860 RepID=UPI003169BAC6